MTSWHCHVGGQQYGPIEDATLRQWVAEGRVKASDLVWCDGMPDWKPASEIPGLMQTPTAQPVGQVAPENPGQGFGIASMVLGICGLLGLCVCGCFALPLAIIGLILGFSGKRKSVEAGATHSFATAGIIMSIITLVLSVIFLIFFLVMMAMGEASYSVDSPVFEP
jgi:hypothetical protein